MAVRTTAVFYFLTINNSQNEIHTTRKNPENKSFGVE